MRSREVGRGKIVNSWLIGHKGEGVGGLGAGRDAERDGIGVGLAKKDLVLRLKSEVEGRGEYRFELKVGVKDFKRNAVRGANRSFLGKELGVEICICHY